MSESRSIRDELKRGMRPAHKSWGIYSQSKETMDSSLVYDHYGTRVLLNGLRVNKPATTVTRVTLATLSGLL